MPAGAGDGERFLGGVGVEPAQHELAAQGAERFDLGRKRLVGGNHAGLDGALPGGEVGVIELAQQGLLDVGVGDEAELLGGVAEAEVLLALQAQHALGVFGLEFAGVDEERANGAVGFGADLGGRVGSGVDDAVECGHGQWAPACGASADVWLCGADAAVLIGALAKLCGAWAAWGFVRRCWWVTACGLTHPTRTRALAVVDGGWLATHPTRGAGGCMFMRRRGGSRRFCRWRGWCRAWGRRRAG